MIRLMKRKSHFKENKKLYLISITIIAFIFLSFLIYINYFDLFNHKYICHEPGTFGDTFGGLNALFSALAFGGLIITILLQREDLQKQKEAIDQTNREMKNQIKEFELNRFTNIIYKEKESISLPKIKQIETLILSFKNHYLLNKNEQISFETINNNVDGTLKYTSDFIKEFIDNCNHSFSRINCINNINDSEVEFEVWRTFFNVFDVEFIIGDIIKIKNILATKDIKNFELIPEVQHKQIKDLEDSINLMYNNYKDKILSNNEIKSVKATIKK